MSNIRLVTGRVATVVLCTPTGELLGQLPPFRAGVPWWQDTADLVGGIRDRHGIDVVILRLLQAALPLPPGGAVTYLAELPDAPPRDLPLAPWVGNGELDQHPLRLPYAEPGGPGRDLAWAASVLAREGFEQAGPAQQMRTWNLSSLWRIPVAESNVWLKCVPPFFAHEGPVLALLQQSPVPRVLGYENGRILMLDVPGEDLYAAEGSILLDMVSMLVDLQAQWCGRDRELLDVGLPDWRASALTDAVRSLIGRTAPDLCHQDRRTLEQFVDGLTTRVTSVEDCGIPTSLVHGDFAPGNVHGDGDHMVLLDWGDCGVGHPFLDQPAFLDRIPPQSVPQVRQHWDSLWREAIPGADPARAAALLAPLAAARQAVIYQKFLDHIEPSEHPYHRLDPALWLTRAANLARTTP